MRNSLFPPTPHRRTFLILAAIAFATSGLVLSDTRASELRRSALVRAIQEARPSIVNIHGQKVANTYDQFGQAEPTRRVNGMGTGVVIDQRGYIITNHHVVHGVRRIQVTLADGATYFARVVSYDKETDLAVIKINAPNNLPVINIGRSGDLMPGETVVAVGNAYGYENTVTRGIISALHRDVQVSEAQEYRDLIQTDASINPGNSGGPLLNVDGEMIGINVAVRAGAQGIGFAIPVDRVLDVAAGLLSAERVDNHWHGIVAKTGSGSKPGAVVTVIEDDSPAARGGLQPGDVIVEAANNRVTRALDFERALLGRKTGEEVEVVVERGQRPQTLSFILASIPASQPTTLERSWKVLGVRVESIPSDEFRQHSTRYRGGLRISSVRPDSPASRQGILSGDILVGMHIWETVSLENLAYILNRPDLNEIDAVKFYILRNNETLFGHLSIASRD